MSTLQVNIFVDINEISWQNCNSYYIGQTYQSLLKRWQQHKNIINSSQTGSFLDNNFTIIMDVENKPDRKLFSDTSNL